MANASIKSAFERLWEHTLVKLNTKSDIGHTHNLKSFGITATVKELNYTGGVTSNIQTQLNNKATKGHTHNHLELVGNNTISSTSADTPANWGAQKNSIHFYNTHGLILNQPSQYGFLLNTGFSDEVYQLWMAQPGGDILHRGGNSAGWASSWKKLLDSSNYSQYALPLTGGEINNGVANSAPLIIRSGHSNITDIGFKNSNGSILGYLGADSSHQAVFNDSSTTHVLLHSGNCSNYCVVNNSIPNFGGVSLGNGFPYIYTENNNINFRYKNGGNTVYTNLLEINSTINNKQNALSKGHIYSVDLNNIVDTGIYMIGGGISNGPFQWGILLVFNPDYAYIGQIGIGSNGVLYHRFRDNAGLWTAWHKNTSTAI